MRDILKGIAALFTGAVIVLALLTDGGAENRAPLGVLKHIQAGKPLVVSAGASVHFLKAPAAKPSGKATPIPVGSTLGVEAVKSFKTRRFARLTQDGQVLGWVSDADLVALGVPAETSPAEARILDFLGRFRLVDPVFWFAVVGGSIFTTLAYVAARVLDRRYTAREAAAGRGEKPTLAGFVHLPVLAGLVVGLTGCFYANRTAHALGNLGFQGAAGYALLAALLAVLFSVAWSIFQSLQRFERGALRACAFSGLMLLAFVGSFLLAFVAIFAVGIAVVLFVGLHLMKSELDPAQHQGKGLACPVCGGVEKHFSGCSNAGTRLANQPLG